MRRCLKALPCALLAAAPALACSGPGARALMFRSTLAGWALFAASVALTVSILVMADCLRTRTAAAAAIVAAALSAAHPGLLLSATSGDCGAMKVLAGGVSAALHAGLAFLVFLGWRRARPSGAPRA